MIKNVTMNEKMSVISEFSFSCGTLLDLMMMHHVPTLFDCASGS